MRSLEIDNTLQAARSGETLADQIAATLRQGQSVRIDFADIEWMTPSFANALVMTLLAEFPLDVLQRHCHFENRCEQVVSAMNSAVRRYQGGIRLSHQLA